jgi:hypothetical protein
MLADNEDCAICGCRIPEDQEPRLTFAASPSDLIMWICMECAGSDKKCEQHLIDVSEQGAEHEKEIERLTKRRDELKLESERLRLVAQGLQPEGVWAHSPTKH